MYRLIDQNGNPACSVRTGHPFEYGRYDLALAAAKALGKRDGRRYEAVAALHGFTNAASPGGLQSSCDGRGRKHDTHANADACSFLSSA